MAEPTNFVETNALLHVMNDDVDEARALVRDMLDGEVYGLEMAANTLAEVCYQERRQRNPRARDGKLILAAAEPEPAASNA